jgi:hypothetical protein
MCKRLPSSLAAGGCGAGVRIAKSDQLDPGFGSGWSSPLCIDVDQKHRPGRAPGATGQPLPLRARGCLGEGELRSHDAHEVSRAERDIVGPARYQDPRRGVSADVVLEFLKPVDPVHLFELVTQDVRE